MPVTNCLSLPVHLTEQQEEMKKIHEKEKEKILQFRKVIKDRLSDFIDDPSASKLEFEPMEKTLRTIVYELVDEVELTAYSFGVEDIDRHCVVFKSHAIPSDEELAALKRGEEYDPEKAALEKEQKAEEEQREREESRKRSRDKSVKVDKYKEKYHHLIGSDAGISAAQITVPNAKFGFVPAENKKDQRSIEQTLADMRARKKAKLEEDHSTD